MAETWHVSRLEVDVRYQDNIPIVTARGECDLITSRKLRETIDSLINTGHCRIIFDFREMTYIDSSGFRVLLDARNRTVNRGGNIALVSLTTPVERVFKLLHLDQLITRAESIEQAVDLLRNSSCD